MTVENKIKCLKKVFNKSELKIDKLLLWTLEYVYQKYDKEIDYPPYNTFAFNWVYF